MSTQTGHEPLKVGIIYVRTVQPKYAFYRQYKSTLSRHIPLIKIAEVKDWRSVRV